jgi:acyl-CoA oxidase
MTKATRSLPLEDPRILPFLPMIYVAWSDGDLTHAEAEAICRQAREAEGLDCDCQEALGAWLDPTAPPTASQLQQLLNRVRSAAQGMDEARLLSLSELGVEIARVAGRKPHAAELGALKELERTLGLGRRDTAAILLPTLRTAEAAPLPEAPFDTAALTRFLDGEHGAIRSQLRERLSQPDFAYLVEPTKATYREHVLGWCRTLAGEGYGALSFPTEYGGANNPGQFIATFETLAHHDLSLLVKFGVQFGLFAGSIHQLGTAKHHQHYLQAASTLELPGCFAMTEIGHGSNVAEVETTARYLPATDEIEIHTPNEAAGKNYIGNAALHGRLATVFAQLQVGDEEHGVHAVLVPIRDAQGAALDGVRIEDCGPKMGLNGVDNGRLWFDHVKVPRESLLDRFATITQDGRYESPINSPNKRFFTMLGTLVGGRVSVALASLSATKSALAIAVRYAEKRRQFGPPGEPEIRILDYLTHQRRLLPRLATAYALHFALADLRRQYVDSEGKDRRAVETRAAGLKAFATDHATDTIQECREACGGEGYLADNRFAALKADTDVFTTFEGDNTVLLQLVAKGLLTGYKKQFESMNLFGLVRYVADHAVTAVKERNPIVTRLTDEANLRSREFHLGALRYREEHVLSTLAQRLRKRIGDGMEAYAAILECQDHLVETAKAHVERVVLEDFHTGIDQARDEGHPFADLLEDLGTLFALHRIAIDRGWFLEHGYLEPNKSKAVRHQINKLCRELRPHALALVDGFGIPDGVLGARIGVEA